MIRYIFGASFKQFSLTFPDVNKNKGVAETAPLSFLDVLMQDANAVIFNPSPSRAGKKKFWRTIGRETFVKMTLFYQPADISDR